MPETDLEEIALRTLIVDDEPLAVERVQVICAEIPAVRVVGWNRRPLPADFASGAAPSATFQPRRRMTTLRAASITAICMPRQMPR